MHRAWYLTLFMGNAVRIAEVWWILHKYYARKREPGELAVVHLCGRARHMDGLFSKTMIASAMEKRGHPLQKWDVKRPRSTTQAELVCPYRSLGSDSQHGV